MRQFKAKYKLIVKDGVPHFVLQSPNSRVIGVSQIYSTIQHALDGIKAVRDLVWDISNFFRMESADGQHYFVVKGKNGEVVLTSEMYKTFAGMRNGISSVMRHGITEEVIEKRTETRTVFNPPHVEGNKHIVA